LILILIFNLRKNSLPPPSYGPPI